MPQGLTTLFRTDADDLTLTRYDREANQWGHAFNGFLFGAMIAFFAPVSSLWGLVSGLAPWLGWETYQAITSTSSNRSRRRWDYVADVAGGYLPGAVLAVTGGFLLEANPWWLALPLWFIGGLAAYGWVKVGVALWIKYDDASRKAQARDSA